MKKSLSLTLFVSAIFAAMFVSCQKNPSEGGNQLSETLTLEDAKSYHQRIESKHGNFDLVTVSGKTFKNFKRVDFSQAYIGENETSFFIEAPISYTTREIVFSAGSGMPKSTVNKMLSNSFDRLVIYKDKMSGMVSEKIVTIIPSVEYSTKDLSNNHYLNISKEFSGYVSYRDWKGKFLSSQSYNQANETARVNDVMCQTETVYHGYLLCEDVDENGYVINCDYFVLVAFPVEVCTMVPPVFHNHQAPLPGANDSYWTGFPDPQVSPGNPCPPYGARVNESPIMFAGVSGSSFSVTLYEACFCQGYSWIILEDVTTHAEYPFPIAIQNFLMTECTSIWETNVQIPASVPNGQYFVKVNLDADVFYHQLEQNGTVTKRWKHTLSR